ncbi:MAG: hypothetical protein JWM91_1773 [Rhodospirillales bacterium]|nr:hypothetical protein [Rhodospirillales bacterium]
MASHASMSNAYDAFLFESLGIEENGMNLSVLSALARAGVDPWAEAKKLAALPRQAAIAAISAILNLGGDGETARRLAELLPRSATPTQTPTPKKFVDRQALFRRYGLIVIVAWLVVAVAFMMFNRSSHPAMPVPDSAAAATR